MADIWADQGGSPNGSPGPTDAIPLHSDQLLSFRTYHRNNVVLLDALNQPVSTSMTAQLHGMFFLAESPWDASGAPAPAGAVNTPKELTCYRRNLFQVSGSLTLPNVHAVVVGDPDTEMTMETLANGRRRVIQSLEATISGIENVEHSPVKIISVPWKNSATQNPTPSVQPPPPASDDFPPTANNTRLQEKEPAPLLFNYPPAYFANPAGIPPEDDDGDVYKWALNWKRLQFRSATANNGRRKDLQQHFMVKLSIYATLFPEDPNMLQVPHEKLDKVLICEAFSNAIIVRGRSPRNFSSRNDIPLTGSAIVSSRHSHSNVNSQSMASAAKKARHMSSSSFDDDQKPDIIYPPDLASHNYSSEYLLEQPHNPMQHIPNELNFAGDLYSAQTNWMDPGTALPLLQSQANLLPQQFFDAGASYQNLTDPAGAARVSLAGLMYSDDFNATSAPQMFSQIPATTNEASMPPPNLTHRPSVPRVTSAQSPSMDLLYEYFPIGIDDFLPPVEVVYRPHNAHHQTQLPTSKTNVRSKRLFSETPFE
ncbi:hypothetical protein ABW19_dt0209818 [Dactylella cylindrospora]|nr:hypothetical protein ABW19_dt0209818 [Dactylella cylindrospora]